ncbi:MAG TPA: FtsX-like permease family protein [Candidatus Limnocylindrales bacterium]|nr:FtsX-like permease family protein [Candidatus Limnocylindrales bacterium]
MIGHMIVQNVTHRPMRTLITVIGVAVEVTLVILVVGLTSGLLQDYAHRTEGVGADVMVQPPSSSVFLSLSSAPMPITIADRLRQLQYVQAVAPVLIGFNSVSALENIFGIDPESFRAVSGGFVLYAGHELQDPNDILVDDIYAKGRRVKVGQTLHVLGHDFHVAGIVEHGKSARLFVLLSTLQEMMGAHDKASVFFIKCDRASHAAAVQDEVKQLLPGYEVRMPKELMALMTSSNVPFLGTFINVMIGIAVIVGFLVTFLSMYTTVIERTREVGVLKSLGASKGYIVQVIISETTLLCALGLVVGIVLSFLARGAMHRIWPSLPILITTGWILRAGVIAILGGVFGATYPAWLASRKDPVEALAYE